MTEEDFFLMDLLARPDDEAARLIYADWLTDRDDFRGDLVREAYLLRSVRHTDPAHKAFADRWHLARRQHEMQEYDGLLLTWEQMVFVFRFRLAEVITHCAGDFVETRRWELEPRGLLGMTYWSGGWPDPDVKPSLWPDLTHELAVARRRLLERSGRATTRLAGHLASGRLVLYDPAVAANDRAAQRQSRDFFDAAGAPPWDSWVMFVPEANPLPGGSRTGYLLAWVPPAWLYWAGEGVRSVAQDRCPVWANETMTPFLRRLREAGVQGC